MKAIIYAGIGLFSVASIYGVADYYQSQKKGELKTLYKEDDEIVAPSNDIKTAGQIIAAKNEIAVADPKKEVKAANTNKKGITLKTKLLRNIKLSDFSRGRIEEPLQVVEEKQAEPVKETVPVKENIPVAEERKETIVVAEPEKKFDLVNFSRAALKRPVKKVKTEKQ